MNTLALDLLLLVGVPLLVAVGSLLTLAALFLATVGTPVWFALALVALWRRDRRLPPDDDAHDSGSPAPGPVTPRRASALGSIVAGAVRP